VLVIALIPLRVWVMPGWFGDHELAVLDGLTADSASVLVSFGGSPEGMRSVGSSIDGVGGACGR